MHNIYGATFIFISYVLLSAVSTPAGNPPVPKSVYEALVDYSNSKCPYLNTTKLLEPKQTFLNSCSDYHTIISLTELTHQTVDSALCLLYYNNIMSLCDSIASVKISPALTNDSIDRALKMNLSTVCQYLGKVKPVKDVENIASVLSNFKNIHVCNKVCVDLHEEKSIPICNMAAYAVFLTELLQNSKNNKTVQHQNNIKVMQKPEIIDASKKNVNVELSGDKDSVQAASQDGSLKSNLVNPLGASGAIENSPNPRQQLKDKIQDGAPSDLKAVEAVTPKLLELPKLKPVEVQKEEKHLSKEGADEQGPANVENTPVVQPANTPSEHAEDKATAVDPSQNKNGNPVTEKPAQNLPASSPDNAETNAVQESENQEHDFEADDGESPGMDLQSSDPISNEDAIPRGRDDDTLAKVPPKSADKVKAITKPPEIDEDVVMPAYSSTNTDEEDSFFFIYFMMVCAVFILGYIGYHNKQKVLALVVEGRRGRRGSRRGRPNSANYHKLDSNLEEAVTSSCNKNTANIIY